MTPEQLLETPDLIAAGVAGDDARRRMHGTRTTFNRVFEIHVDAPPTSLPQNVHAGEFRIVGKPSTTDALLSAVRATAAIAGGVPVTVFSVADLLSLPQSIRAVASAIKEAGASAIVHLPIDLVENAELVAQDVRAADLTILTIGLEELDDRRRLQICEMASALQSHAGGFKAFAPLPRKMSVTKPTTGYDDVRMVALARIVVQNIESIQVDWALYGPKLAQVALTVGANDVDNVAAEDPGILGTRRSPLEEIKRNIVAASLEPLERNGCFATTPNSKLQTPNLRHEIFGVGGLELGVDSDRQAVIRLGAVNYLNARPLVHGLDQRTDLFALRFDPPSVCATLLHESSIDVGMIPSIEYCRGDDYRIAPGHGHHFGRRCRVGCALHVEADPRGGINRCRHQLADVERAIADTLR